MQHKTFGRQTHPTKGEPGSSEPEYNLLVDEIEQTASMIDLK
jgi:hypothetical protein